MKVTAYSLKSVAEYGKLKPEKGEKLLILDLGIVNEKNAKAVKYGPRMFKLIDADAREVPPSLKDYTNRLQSNELDKGEKVRGVLAFIVTGTKKLRLQYKPSGWKDADAFDLPLTD